MTNTTTEAVERLIARLNGQDPIPSRSEVAEQCAALLAERDALKAQLAAIQTPDPVTNADSCQPTRTYEDGVRDALAQIAALETPMTEDCMIGHEDAYRAVEKLIKDKSHE